MRSLFVFGCIFFAVVVKGQAADLVDSLDYKAGSANVQVVWPQGYFVKVEDATIDSLSLALNVEARATIWRNEDWNWTQRENSASGGLVFNSIDPFLSTNSNGWARLSKGYLKKPVSHSASSPRTDMSLLTGIGGGQLFGLRTLSPVDSNKQFFIDYLRNNTVGLYRNEGTDGHELKVSLYSAVDTLKDISIDRGLTINYLNNRIGSNGGLSNAQLFEVNAPTLRRNFSIADGEAELFEESFELEGFIYLKGLKWTASVQSDAWAVGNNRREVEYYWDSTGVLPEVLSRNLRYSDTLRMNTAQLEAMYSGSIGTRLGFDIAVKTGLENVVSNDQGWDAFRTDSIIPTVSFSTLLQPFVRISSKLEYRLLGKLSYQGKYAVNVIGFNAGAYDLRNRVMIGGEAGSWSLGVNLLYQPSMFRLEQLYGYSYDFRNIDKPYLKNELDLEWGHGKSWRKEMVIYGAQINGMRYLEDFDELTTWDGQYGRVQLGVHSDRKGWNTKLQAYGVAKSSFGGFATPNWGGCIELDYRSSIGSRFELRSGFNISVEDAFYTPTYSLGVPIWSLQQEHLAGSYPWANVFFEARIANFIAGVRIVNALEGLTDYNYYAFGATPRTDRWVQLSARWTLFN